MSAVRAQRAQAMLRLESEKGFSGQMEGSKLIYLSCLMNCVVLPLWKARLGCQWREHEAHEPRSV